MNHYHHKHHWFEYVVAIGVAGFLGMALAFGIKTGVNNIGILLPEIGAIDQTAFLGRHVYVNNNVIKVATPKVALAESSDIVTATTTNLVFVGDIMMDRGVEGTVKRRGGDYDLLFHRVPFLKEADISFANLEGVVSDRGTDRYNLYSFRMDPESIEALVNSGLDVLSVANNHIGDWGLDAFVDTLNRLADAGLVYVGGDLNQAKAEAVKIIEKNGIKFGFVGFSDVGPNDLAVVGDQPGIVIAGADSVARVVGVASKQADVVIASFHFGDEYVSLPSERQKMLARLAVDSGAEIVVGHHPHVIQPVEFYNGGVIAYSLGNFIFDQYFSEATMTGGVLEVAVSADGQIAQVATSTVGLSYDFIPELKK